ncbi:hypothetical protein ACH4E5_38040 [Streptomyces afghaniensis]|uniref:hypothetical protein n=1 Tax=Streptomyces afghaniensis TaxID=66865 RepID=UPI00379FA644
MRERIDQMVAGFKDALEGLKDVLEDLPAGQEYDTGYEAAHAALAPIAWSKAVGDRIDTPEAMKVTNVSRQALQKQVRNETLLGIPGKTTTYFPKWQFDFHQSRVRPEAKRILRAFKSRGQFDPHMIAAWMNTPNADLGQDTPAHVLENGEEVERLIEVAVETAESWAS